MRLSDLYPSGTKMSEVHPDFRGMSLERWKLLKISEQANAYQKTITAEQKKAAPISAQRIWTPRDSYGMKGV
jgi:hypothetical protein